MTVVGSEEELPPVGTVSSSSSSCGSEKDDDLSVMSEEKAALEHDTNNEMDDSGQRFRDSDDILRPSVVPKWVQEVEAGLASSSHHNNKSAGSLSSSLHKSDGSLKSLGKSAEIPKGSESSAGSFAPDWLKDFEAEQKKLFEAMDSRSSLKAGGSSLIVSSSAHNKNEQEEAAPLGVIRRESESTRLSVAPEWLKGFEAEQMKLLEAMNSHTAQNNQDSFAMYEDTSDDDSVATGPKLREPTEKARRESEASRPSMMFDFMLEFEEQQKTLLKALESRASLIGDSMFFMQQGEKSAHAASNKEEDTLTAEAPVDPPKQSTETKRESTVSRKSVRPSVVPEWLVDFEKKQKTLLKALDSRASMIGDSMLFMAEDNAIESEGAEPIGKMRRESESSRPSIAPDWLKDFEKRQNHLLDNLATLATAQSNDKGWDDFGHDEEPDLLPPLSQDKVGKERGQLDPRNTTAETSETSTVASVTPPPARSTADSNEGSIHAIQPISLTKSLFDESDRPAPPIATEQTHKTPKSSKVTTGVADATQSTGGNEFQKVQLRKTPKSMERHKTETKLEFAEMIANALSKNKGDGQGSSSLEALRHINDLKQQVVQLQEQEEVGSEMWQINKLRHELLEMFDQSGALHEEELLNWLLPMHQERDEKTGQLAMNADQVALLQAFSTSEELNMVSGLGMVKSVMQSNYKAIDGSSCLETIRDYAMLKLGKKKKQRNQQPWEVLAELFDSAQKDGSTEDIHLRVRNALVLWVVREILGTSRDTVSSRMCFHAVFLIASLKLELERVSPVALRLSETHDCCKSLGNEVATESKRSSRKGVLPDAPMIIKKLLDRDQNGPKDAPPAPVDLPPDEEPAVAGSDKVAFVRETLVTGLEDKLEEQAKITSRLSTFVKMDPVKKIDESAVADAVNSFVLPTNFNEDSTELSVPFLSPSNRSKPDRIPEEEESQEPSERAEVNSVEIKKKPASPDLRDSMVAKDAVAASLEILDGSGRESSNHENQGSSSDVVSASPDAKLDGSAKKSLDEDGHPDESTKSALFPCNNNHGEVPSSQAENKPMEDHSNLPLPVQDAHRVIRTILGPSHPNITVSLCFEAIRVYAALIEAWRDVCAEDGTLLEDGQTLATSGPRPSSEELKLKSLEGTILRRGAILPPAQIDMQIEEERKRELEKQEEEERRARESIARKREEKKKKKRLMKTKTNDSSTQDASMSESGARRSAEASEPSSPSDEATAASSAKSSTKKSKKSSKKKKSESAADAHKKVKSKTKKAAEATQVEAHRRKTVLGKLKGGVSKLKPKKKSKRPPTYAAIED